MVASLPAAEPRGVQLESMSPTHTSRSPDTETKGSATASTAATIDQHVNTPTTPTIAPLSPTTTTEGANAISATPSLSRPDLLRLLTCGFAFFCSGINDGSLGPLIPYLLPFYSITTNLVAVIYSITFLGWFSAAVSNSHLAQFLDLGAILIFGAALQLIAQLLRCWGPPFPVFVLSFWFAHLGQAYQDMHANSWVAERKGVPHRWLGFIHASYAGGCLVGPFVATAVAAGTTAAAGGVRGGRGRWFLFYVFPAGMNVVNVGVTAWAFWGTVRLRRKGPVEERAVVGEEAEDVNSRQRQSRNKDALHEMKETLGVKAVWILSLFFFFYLGTAITAGGWVVTYLVDVRRGALSAMGYVQTGYYGGAFLGRILLAEPTHRYGERTMILIYTVLCLALQLVFWLVPSIIAGAVAISFLGFFSGPFFATGVSMGSKLFPGHVRHSALAVVFVTGQIGGSIFPAVTGVIAARAGVSVLQPILVGLICATGLTWLCLPKVDKHRD